MCQIQQKPRVLQDGAGLGRRTLKENMLWLARAAAEQTALDYDLRENILCKEAYCLRRKVFTLD